MQMLLNTLSLLVQGLILEHWQPDRPDYLWLGSLMILAAFLLQGWV